MTTARREMTNVRRKMTNARREMTNARRASIFPKWQMANGESTPGIHLNGREATEFAFLDKNSKKWVNIEKRHSPPGTMSMFEQTISETMKLLEATPHEIDQVTKKINDNEGGTGKRKHPARRPACASTPGKDQEGKRQR